MSTNLHVGNLTYATTSADLMVLFAQHGDVEQTQVITDRDSGRSRGYGFVEMASSTGAKEAIDSLNGHDLNGRDLTVAIAKPRSR